MIRGFFYRGRHRRPTRTARNAAALATTGALAVVPLVMSSGTAQAAEKTAPDWGPIVQCESSGNPRATNGSHFGLFQFDLPTWRSVGGTGNPMDASVAEQYRRANMLHAQRGLQPWAASRHCWGGKVGSAPSTPAPAAKPAPAQRAGGRHHEVEPGDTLSEIAVVHGTTWQALAKKNRGTVPNPHLIFPGQQIVL